MDGCKAQPSGLKHTQLVLENAIHLHFGEDFDEQTKLSNFVQSPFGHRTYSALWYLFIINAYGADMKKTMIIVSAALAGVVLLSGGAGAQGTSQTVEVAKVDVQTLPGGFRASKVIGSSVLNDANETIGKIDDVLISPDGKAPFAVLSINLFRDGFSLGCCPL